VSIDLHPIPTPLTQDGFAELVSVSRETQDRLRCYVDLLGKWNERINLVGPATLADVWRRHMLDSAQLYRMLPASVETLVDLGSGAGLPGLILAILGVPNVHLIESDARKAVFLQEAARVTGTAVKIHRVRIEAAPRIEADIVTARALAKISLLLEYSSRFLKPGGSCYLLKGARWTEEMVEARKNWRMTSSEIPSLSEASGIILKLESIVREREQ
jgi:16S rRNA (guanine527-N7)-methyltransferase